MTSRVMLAMVITLAFGAAGQAQVPSQPSDTFATRYIDPVAGLDLATGVTQALEREPSLRAARTEVGAAKAMRLQAALHPNPTVSFVQQNEPAGTDRQTRAEVVWPLDLFRKAGRVSVADREVDVVGHKVRDRERLLVSDVRAKYGAVAAAIRALTVLDDVLGAASSQLRLIAARVDQGATPPLERDVLRVELQRLASDRLVQAGAVERGLIELKRVLGMSIDAPLRIRDSLEQLVENDGAAVPSGNRAMIAPVRPDVDVAQARLQVADAQIARARREGRVDVNLFGMYMRMDAGFPLRAFGAAGGLEAIRDRFHYVAAGAIVTVPLRNRNQGAVVAAQAQRAGAAADLDAARLVAEADAAAARARDKYAREALAVYTADTRALAKLNLSVVGQSYELGRATVFDVLAEQRRFLEVEGAFTDALREAYEARQALRRALGEGR